MQASSVSDHFPLSGGLHHCLGRLNSLQGTQLESSLHGLLRPVWLCGHQQQLPALATLPLAAQTNLLLLLRAAPHRFSASHQAAVLAGCAGLASWQPPLLQLLAAETGGGLHPEVPLPVPACPTFLYTTQPCLPWAPVLADHATATALHEQQAAAARRRRQHKQQQAQHAHGGKRGAQEPEEEVGGNFKRQRRAADDTQHPTTLTTQSGAGGATPSAEEGLASAISTVQTSLPGGGGGAAPTSITAQLRKALDELLSHAAAGSATGAAALHAAGLGSLQDDSLLLLLLSELVTGSSSFARCCVAAGGLLLPRLSALQGPAPRDLAAAAEHVGSCNPQAFISACLQPLLGRPGLNKHQSELLSSTCKAGLPPRRLPEVLAAACAPAPAASAAASGSGAAPAEVAAAGSGWNEHTVAVLQSVLNVKPALTAAGVAQLAAAFQAATLAPAGGAELAASVKFAKLLLSVVKQYPIEAAAAKQPLLAAAQATKSFMSKSLMAAVAKL